MRIAVKYLILITGFLAAFSSFYNPNTGTGTGIIAAGAFISYALIEIQDLKISNDKEA